MMKIEKLADDYLFATISTDAMLEILTILRKNGIVEMSDGTRGIHLSLNEKSEIYGVITTRTLKK